MVGGKWAPALLRQVTFSVALMTVGELKAVLCGYDANTHVVAVWLRPHQAPEGGHGSPKSNQSGKPLVR